MAKKIVKKRKLKLFKLLILLLIIIVIVFCSYILLNTKIKNIIIKNNKYLTDEEIIENTNLTNYPSFFYTTSYSIEKKLKKLEMVDDVKVTKKFFNVIVINIKEHNVVLKNSVNNTYILSNGKEITSDKEYRVPRLTNKITNNKYKSLVTNLNEIKKSVLGEISEIEYVPNDYDKDRFLLYMDDGNSVYLTLTKFEMINYYDKVLSQLEGKKGILYLDSGNHFKIMS